MDWNHISTVVQTTATEVGLKVLGAIVIWIIGRWLIGFTVGLIQRGLNRQKVDSTLTSYASNTIAVLLNLVLVLAIFGYFGVQTTTFAALLAAAGLAIGAAWSGLLANFAAGAFLVVLRPFKVGDFISAAGVTGTVVEIGLFATTIDTGDNIRTFVGNNKLFGDNIQNFSTNPYRRVDLLAQIPGSADPNPTIEQMKVRLLGIPNVKQSPKPEVVIQSVTPAGPVLAVRPYCHNDHYWQVYFDANVVIREVLG